MKNYRVWEANRKVLLYPENWIEPELRDDKTPFFDDLVSALQQGDVASDKAQLAVQTFLEKLTDFSRMEIVATCSSYDDEQPSAGDAHFRAHAVGPAHLLLPPVPQSRPDKQHQLPGSLDVVAGPRA